jgi:hypothetical protein
MSAKKTISACLNTMRVFLSGFCHLWIIGLLMIGRCWAQVAPAPATAWTSHRSVPLSTGLVGWWMADGDAKDALGLNHGRTHLDVSIAAGLVGQGFTFGGDKGYIKVATSELNVGAGDGLTIELWIKPEALAKKQPLIGWAGTTTPGVSLWIAPGANADQGVLGADLPDVTNHAHSLVTDAQIITRGQWQHIALSYDRRSGLATLYRDAIPVQVRALGTVTAETQLDVYFGKHLGIDGGKTVFRGAMDEISIYNRALSPTEIGAIYYANSAGKSVSSLPFLGAKNGGEEERVSKRLGSFITSKARRPGTFIKPSPHLANPMVKTCRPF